MYHNAENNFENIAETVFFLLIALILPLSGLGCLPDPLTLDQPFLKEGNLADIPDLSGAWKLASSTVEDDNFTIERTDFNNTFIARNDNFAIKIIIEPLGNDNFIAQFESLATDNDIKPGLLLLKYTHKQAIFPEFALEFNVIKDLSAKYGITINDEEHITEFRSDQDLKLSVKRIVLIVDPRYCVSRIS